MVKTAYFGHFGEKMFFILSFFLFQNQTFSFLIIKNKNLSSKMVKTAFFGHFGAKNIIHHDFFMFQDLTFTFQAESCPLIGLRLKVKGVRTSKKHLIRV